MCVIEWNWRDSGTPNKTFLFATFEVRCALVCAAYCTRYICTVYVYILSRFHPHHTGNDDFTRAPLGETKKLILWFAYKQTGSGGRESIYLCDDDIWSTVHSTGISPRTWRGYRARSIVLLHSTCIAPRMGARVWERRVDGFFFFLKKKLVSFPPLMKTLIASLSRFLFRTTANAIFQHFFRYNRPTMTLLLSQ